MIKLKGYVRYKNNNFQNVACEAQVKNFLLRTCYVPLSRYSSFCIFNNPMIYQICDVMMSIITWDRVHYWIYLLYHNWLSNQTWSIDRYKQGHYFFEIFWTIWRFGAKFQALFNLTAHSNCSVTNCVKFPVFHFFERLNKVELKIVNINY